MVQRHRSSAGAVRYSEAVTTGRASPLLVTGSVLAVLGYLLLFAWVLDTVSPAITAHAGWAQSRVTNGLAVRAPTPMTARGAWMQTRDVAQIELIGANRRPRRQVHPTRRDPAAELATSRSPATADLAPAIDRSPIERLSAPWRGCDPAAPVEDWDLRKDLAQMAADQRTSLHVGFSATMDRFLMSGQMAAPQNAGTWSDPARGDRAGTRCVPSRTKEILRQGR